METKIEITRKNDYWMNFVQSLMVEHWDYHKFILLRDKVLLEEYNARIVTGRPNNFLVFNDSKQATLFILRWS